MKRPRTVVLASAMLATLLVPVAATSGVPGSGDASAHPIAATPNVGQVGVVPPSVIDSDPDPATDELGTASLSRSMAPRLSSYGRVGGPFFARPSGLLTSEVRERGPPTGTMTRTQAATSKVPSAKLYDIRVTTKLDTKWIDGGCGQYCDDEYQGTYDSTQVFRNVRIHFKKPYNLDTATIESPFDARGTGSGAFDHRSRFCKRDELEVKGAATASVYGQYPVPGPEPLPTLRIQAQFPPRYSDTCIPRIQSVPLAARVGGSLVKGTLSENGVQLDLLAGMLPSGAGFPIDRLLAGKGFLIDLKGKSIVRDEDFKTSKYANVTTGSVRITFSQSGRAAASTRTPDAPSAACPKSYPEWWSKKVRACFLISASAHWRDVTSWTTDENGQPCKGNDTRSGSWTSSPVSFWVGDSFPVGYTASRARTFNIFEGAVVKAKLGRRVSGGARQYGCVPMLAKDCGTRTATFRHVGAEFASVDGSFAYVPKAEGTISPFRACGLVAGDGAFNVAPEWAGFAPFPIPASDAADIGKRLLKVPVGETLVLRGAGGPPLNAPGTGLPKETGAFTGKLVFRRVK